MNGAGRMPSLPPAPGTIGAAAPLPGGVPLIERLLACVLASSLAVALAAGVVIGIIGGGGVLAFVFVATGLIGAAHTALLGLPFLLLLRRLKLLHWPMMAVGGALIGVLPMLIDTLRRHGAWSPEMALVTVLCAGLGVLGALVCLFCWNAMGEEEAPPQTGQMPA